jgi:F-type H+-transporting ATPase subunit a
MMWIAAALVVFVFRYAFREQRIVPSGIANLLEAIVVFLRDEVVLPNMGEAGRPYLPYLLPCCVLSCIRQLLLSP